ncbi:CRISPR-associated endonuclease/helicase Cas3 [Sporotomaculum syntrophicum]|uniref:CRISPR-associated endonuclease/helicase Cas3 n=1 Tax=Sporotomaculum syntrophicum TaxID=182264 RepID=A0A9D2WLN8_9FIRM|nr:CRISPR-associated helicase Cas3' [Sporotomaculum syntrophicum]KAF1083732.1 CRISPR-associated endonuclease/helicase Cas3 [Sporotomaculum syntrophicum]
MFYAKSQPGETIKEHTDLLLAGLQLLRKSYGHKINAGERFWELLRTAALYHDFGKANVLFQNKMRKLRGEDTLPCSLSSRDEIPHNFVSVALIPFNELGLTKEEWRFLVEAIGFHHERNTLPNSSAIQAYVQQTISRTTVEALFKHMGLPYRPEESSKRLLKLLEKDRKPKYDQDLHDKPEFFRQHVLLKGLLHRLDHAVSAHVAVETGVEENTGEKTYRFLQGNFGKLQPAQEFAMLHRDRNVIMAASTGTGKTEAALLWAGEEKAFITLPLRVSLNAMYDRLREGAKIGLEHLGLLHSGSLDYLTEKDLVDGEETYQVSRQLSQKIMLTTIDQVLKFPFLYKGFEKELATFAYSKLVIDEIQAYDPNIAAMLIKALEMVVKIGGKFMIMTATLPKLYLETISSRGVILEDQWVYRSFPNDDLKRHRIHLHDSQIKDVTESIIDSGRQNKVLVICNTVDRAIAVYQQLKEQVKEQLEQGQLNKDVPVWLLHARFIKKHKLSLEQRVTKFAESGWHQKDGEVETGIWVTTQIVEASLDVDFDELYTEMCSLDSLFQRMGRCYRIRRYAGEEPNVHIFTANASGIGTVYDKVIVQMSSDALQPLQNRIMLESEKMLMVERLYSKENLRNTSFLQKFNEAIIFFDNQLFFETESREAQDMLRNIRSREAIPWKFHDKVEKLIKQLGRETDKNRRRKCRQEIEKMSVPLNEKTLRIKDVALCPLEARGLEHLSWIMDTDADYEFDENTLQGSGLVYKKKADIF